MSTEALLEQIGKLTLVEAADLVKKWKINSVFLPQLRLQ